MSDFTATASLAALVPTAAYLHLFFARSQDKLYRYQSRKSLQFLRYVALLCFMFCLAGKCPRFFSHLIQHQMRKICNSIFMRRF